MKIVDILQNAGQAHSLRIAMAYLDPVLIVHKTICVSCIDVQNQTSEVSLTCIACQHAGV